jgi:two-component system, chemotaxis family, protein-glutamate methylesterase/glutaminase
MRRVLVADRPGTARQRLLDALAKDGALKVVGVAHDGEEAVALCLSLRPDIMTVARDLPVLDGLAVTRRLMADQPTPIIIITSDETARSMEALRAGALALARPPVDGGLELRAMIHSLADVKLVRRANATPFSAAAARSPGGRFDIVALAASAGGPPALARLLSDLPGTPRVPFIAVQHNSKGWMPALATWLQTTSGRPVKLATEGEILSPGTLYLAPDGAHLGVDASGHARFGQEGPIGGFRPSASYLFDSVGKAYGPHALAVILTGMGTDGTAGLRGMHERGARVIAQDEESSAVFGMPGAAVAAGVCDEVLPLSAIAARVAELVSQR